MTAEDLCHTVESEQGSGLEFLRHEVPPERVAKACVAFANHCGGRVLLGVDDDGRVVGITRPDLERWVMDTVFTRYVHPWILPSYEEVEVDDGRRVAVITVAQGVAKPYVVRN